MVWARLLGPWKESVWKGTRRSRGEAYGCTCGRGHETWRSFHCVPVLTRELLLQKRHETTRQMASLCPRHSMNGAVIITAQIEDYYRIGSPGDTFSHTSMSLASSLPSLVLDNLSFLVTHTRRGRFMYKASELTSQDTQD